MLARVNRLVRAEDYRNVVRRGRRVVGKNTVVYLFRRDDSFRVRFGFITARSIGGAVVRNRVRRRLKAICALELPQVKEGTDIVIRALPGSSTASWVTLQSEVVRGLSKGSGT